jgi:hypothetical protein
MPYFLFDITPLNHAVIPHKYNRAEVFQSNRIVAKPGEVNVPVLQTVITSLGAMPPPVQLTHFNFSGKGSGSRITAAKLYYTGTGEQSSSSFNINTATHIQTITGAALLNDVFYFTNNIAIFPNGIYNF